ncbi:MAG: tRNA pseudouridine(55) synthase TruB [Gammaproteobacteria bacterium]|nr:tRNA pseudouridine(55) synthase TruB [Gammaproteobacteria bacterium]
MLTTNNLLQSIDQAESGVSPKSVPADLDSRLQQGLFLLDKSSGMSSNMALQKVKRLLGVKKAGHTGSLDPLASGLLPICIGRATRLSSYLLNDDKRYVVAIKLGVRTETGDAEGAVISEQAVSAFNSEILGKVLASFIGEIQQVPPMYSALKHNGKRLYELARQGIVVERKARQITVHQITLLGYDKDLLTLDVTCTKGTYIRTLAEDIGEKLGCGAHVNSLRRTEVGDLSLNSAWTLEQLAALETNALRRQCVLGADKMLAGWASVQLTEELAFYFCRGQAVWIPKLPTSGWLRVYKEDLFIGIAEIASDGKLAPRRLIAESV